MALWRFGLLGVLACTLMGCVDFDNVDQPSTGISGEPVDIELAVTINNFVCPPDVEDECLAEVAVEMPASWTVQACSLTVDGYSSTTNCLGNFTPGDRLISLTQQAGYEWKVLHAAPGISMIPDPNNPTVLTGTVRLRIVPDSIGDFELNYAGNGYGWALGVNTMRWALFGGASGPHPISIQAAQTAAPATPQPVPMDGVTTALALALGLVSMPFLASRRRQAKRPKNQQT